MVSENPTPDVPEQIEMPAPTFWPLVLAAGVTLIGAGLVTNYAFSAIGLVVFLIALGNWMAQLMPGAGHIAEPVVEPERRAQAIVPQVGEVERLRMGMPGHRLRIPEKVHPYSAGAKGGVVGGIAMMAPALLYGLISEHSLWYPVNLLAGMVLQLPRLPDGSLDTAALEQFHLSWMVAAILIHATISVGLGLIYGVLLPMLPGQPMFWGGIVAPLLWTGAIYGFMGILNPALSNAVDWTSFILAQFIYGIVVGLVVVRSEKVYSEPAGSGPVGDQQPQRNEPEEGRS